MIGSWLDSPMPKPNGARSSFLLAGLLEAEGTFLRPPPSSPRSPQVVCRMTDRDVIERVADRFGTTVFSVDKGQYRTVNSATSSRSRSAGGTRCIRGRPSAQSTAEGDSVSSLARSFGVARQTIHRILKREIYWAPPPRPWRDKATMLPDPAYLPEGMSRGELYWLVGWLEGEGCFLAPPPSSPRRGWSTVLRGLSN